MEKVYYDKTEKGREEISSRKFHLSPKLRPLLVMIDGKHSSEELLNRLSAIGLNHDHLAELIAAGFVEETKAINVNPTLATATLESDQTKPSPSSVQFSPMDKQHAMVALRQFFTDSIKTNLGLRGFTLQLRVERADTLDDFKSLGEDLIEALHNSKGQQLARTLEARMTQLLAQASSVT